MNGINIKFEVNLQSQLQLILEISVDSPFVLDPDFGPDCMDFAVLGAGGRAGGGPVQSKKDMFTIHYLLFTIHEQLRKSLACFFYFVVCLRNVIGIMVRVRVRLRRLLRLGVVRGHLGIGTTIFKGFLEFLSTCIHFLVPCILFDAPVDL